MNYDLLIKQALSLIEDESDIIANLANISALLNESLPDINWVGFYIYKEDQLVLGPFQGKVACTRLFPGKGVCMAALESNKTLNVPDVHAFPGHVACDSASNSELVVPIFINTIPYGVLDIDSPLHSRFSDEDALQITSLIEQCKQKIFM